MEEEKNLVRIGRLSKPKGLKGHIHAFINPEFVSRLKKVEALYLNINSNKIPYFVDEYEMSENGHSLLLFEGINNRTKAETLHGKDIYTGESNLKKQNKFDNNSYLNGYVVVDETLGEIGTVTDVFESSAAHPMIEIQHEEKKVIVPLVEEYNLNINKRNKTITLLLPDGMLDL